MQFTDEEQRYLQCLADQMTFQETAVELAMTVEQVEDFGDKLFDRVFADKEHNMN